MEIPSVCFITEWGGNIVFITEQASMHIYEYEKMKEISKTDVLERLHFYKIDQYGRLEQPDWSKKFKVVNAQSHSNFFIKIIHSSLCQRFLLVLLFMISLFTSLRLLKVFLL